MLTTQQRLLDAAGRPRSPATLPGYPAGRPPRNRDCAIRPIHRESRRLWRSCARRATAFMVRGFEA
jgi:hypothetical protein